MMTGLVMTGSADASVMVRTPVPATVNTMVSVPALVSVLVSVLALELRPLDY